MKKLFLLLFAVVLFAACGGGATNEEVVCTKTECCAGDSTKACCATDSTKACTHEGKECKDGKKEECKGDCKDKK